MELDTAKELLQTQISMGGRNSSNGVKIILLEVSKAHGQQAVDQLIKELELEEKFGFKPGGSLFV
ncbi:MAG: hypothetical protein OEY52_05860 [Gammaproteobacteria bacterium]|nr:hypothetical protein [Gammaproteobacteria bacterium]